MPTLGILKGKGTGVMMCCWVCSMRHRCIKGCRMWWLTARTKSQSTFPSVSCLIRGYPMGRGDKMLQMLCYVCMMMAHRAVT